MICLWRNDLPKRPVICLFGAGLVGHAIAQSLVALVGCQMRHFPYSWGQPNKQAIEHQAIADFMARNGTEAVHMIWAAGKSGFGSSEADMQIELEELSYAIGLQSDLRQALGGPHSIIHLIGSAGGLFEGQSDVGPNTLPHPQRPYGHGKLDQEALVHEAVKGGHFTAARVYRVSTAYGFVPGGRNGLITTLLCNGLLRKETRIIGKPTTLRDYIFVRDIGSLVAKRTAMPLSGFATEYLVSGRPSAMNEVIHIASQTLGTQVYLRYETQTSNDRDIGFLSSCRPVDLITTPLDIGIRQVAQDMRGTHALLEQGS